MNRVLTAGAVALTFTLGTPVMAQTAGSASDLAAAQAQIEALKQQLERVEATVDYLKANATAERKESAQAAVDTSALKSASDKYVWSGDFRFRHELIDQAVDNNSDSHTRQRDRVRVRFGVLAKVNDDISVKLQLSTVGESNQSARSRNQTLGTSWTSESIGIDLMYADWKPNAMTHVLLGKMPMPWVTTPSYFWDKDLTPEGAALKFARGPLFANLSYMWLNERNVAGNQGASTDATLAAIQVGWKQSFGDNTFTLAGAYNDVAGVQDQIVKYSSTSVAPPGGGTVVTTTCTIDGAFGGGAGTGDNSFGNTAYTGTAPQIGSTTSCTRLLSDFDFWSVLAQWDTKLGNFPFTVFGDYQK
ncbi:MAG TPA: putative porin, partial [Steroidobacteraceae bacterium]|nr:putative porin [Steroidobacteraceae bacterium]